MSEWISVKDRLPKDGQKALIIHQGDIDLAIYEDLFWDYSPQNIEINMVQDKITHWMPLPEVPQ